MCLQAPVTGSTSDTVSDDTVSGVSPPRARNIPNTTSSQQSLTQFGRREGDTHDTEQVDTCWSPRTSPDYFELS
jgi:hypothetical protein